jgi:hypothetical protein
MRSAGVVGGLSPDVDHSPGSGHEIRLSNVVPRFFPLNNRSDEFGKFSIRSPASHQFVQIVVPYGKKTGSNLAV